MAPPRIAAGNALINKETGKKRWFPQNQLKSAILSEDWEGQPNDQMRVMNSAGGRVTIDAADALQAFAEMGMNPEAEANIRHVEKEARLEEKYGDAPIQTFVESVAGGLTFNLSDYLGDREGIKQRRARHSGWLTGIGTGAGVVLGAVVSGGGSLLAKGVGAGAGAAAKGTAGRVIAPRAAAATGVETAARFLPSGAANIAGLKAGRLLLPAEVGASVSGKRMLAARMLQGATEGVIYGGVSTVAMPALSDDPITAEALWSEMKAGALWGGAFGGAFSILAEGGLYLKGKHARRVTKIDEAILEEKGIEHASILEMKAGWEAKAAAKLDVGEAKKTEREAVKDVKAAEKAQTAERKDLAKEKKAAEKELAKIKDAEVAAWEDVRTAEADVKKAQVKIDRLEKQLDTKKRSAEKKRLTIELGAAKLKESRAKKARDAVDTRLSEFEKQKGRSTESINKEIKDLTAQLEKKEGEWLSELEGLGAKHQTAQDLVANLEHKRNSISADLTAKRSKENLASLDLELEEAIKVEKAAAKEFDENLFVARSEFDALNNQIADVTLTPAKGAPDKFIDRMLILRESSEGWMQAGRRTWRRMGKEAGIDSADQDPYSTTSMAETEKRVIRANNDYDEYFVTQKSMGVPMARAAGKDTVEYLRARREGRHLIIDEEIIIEARNTAVGSYTKMHEAIEELEDATREHAATVMEEAMVFGDDFIRGFPKLLDLAYGPQQLSASQYLSQLTAATEGKMAKLLSSREGPRAASKVSDIEDGRIIREASEQREQVAGERARAAWEAKVDSLEASIAKTNQLENQGYQVEAKLNKAREDLADLETKVAVVEGTGTKPGEMFIREYTPEMKWIEVPAVTAEKPWYVRMEKRAPTAGVSKLLKRRGKFLGFEPKLYSTEEVLGMIERGELNSRSSVWGKGFTGWEDIEKHFDLGPETAKVLGKLKRLGGTDLELEAERARKATAALEEGFEKPKALPGKVEPGGESPYRSMEFVESRGTQPEKMQIKRVGVGGMPSEKQWETVPSVTAEKPWYAWVQTGKPGLRGTLEHVRIGPISTEKIFAMVKKGDIDPGHYGSLVWTKGSTEWEKIKDHFNFDYRKSVPGKVSDVDANITGRVDQGDIAKLKDEIAAAESKKAEIEASTLKRAEAEKELEELIAAVPEESGTAVGALTDAKKKLLVANYEAAVGDIRDMGTQTTAAKASRSQAYDEVDLRKRAAEEQAPGSSEALQKAEENLKRIDDIWDDTMSNSADIKEVKAILARAVEATSAAEQKKIALAFDLKFGSKAEGGPGKKKKKKKQAEAEGPARGIMAHGASAAAYHMGSGLLPGAGGAAVGGVFSGLMRAISSKFGKKGKKSVGDAAKDAAPKWHDKISYAVGSFIGVPGLAVKLPSYATTTQGMIDSIKFTSKKFEGEKIARLSPLQQSYYDKVKEIRAIVANPETLMDTLMDATVNLRALNPEVANQVVNNELRRIMYIASLIPQTPPMGYAGSSYDEHIPADSNIAKFARAASAAYHPLSVMAKLSKGTLTASEAKAFRETSPETFIQIQEEFVMRLSDKKNKLPFAKRIQLSILFDLPADSVMSAIMQRQSIFQIEQPGADLSSIKQSIENQATNTQRISQ